MPLKKSSAKDELRSKILRTHSFGTKSRALILLDIQNAEIRDFLLAASSSLDFSVVTATGTEQEKSEYAGYDAFVTDGISGNLYIVGLIQSGAVPILPLENAYPKTFSEFDPMKFLGNAFLFDTIDKYKILEKIIRYLENIRYAGDKRTLLTNVEKTF